MKILQLCNKVPYPANDGGAIAALNFTNTFTALGHNVTVLAMSTPKHSITIEDISSELRQKIDWNIVFINNPINPIDALKALISNKSYNILRFDNQEYRNELIKLLTQKEFDIIQLEGLFLCPYIDTIRQYHKGKISLRAHNIEHEIWYRMAKQTKNPLKRFYLNILAKQLKRYEVEAFKKADLILPITEKDREAIYHLNRTAICHTAPVGMDFNNGIQAKSIQHNIFFIGSLDWLPNIEGLQWFFDKVWPKVDPNIQLKIAGRNTPEEIYEYSSDRVQILGEIDDAKLYIQENGLMIAPLLSGSGMRVKLVEGMLLKKCMITSSVGAEGIEAAHKQEILIADNAEDFANLINEYANKVDEQIKIGEAAYRFAEKQFSNINITEEVIAFYENN